MNVKSEMQDTEFKIDLAAALNQDGDDAGSAASGNSNDDNNQVSESQNGNPKNIFDLNLDNQIEIPEDLTDLFSSKGEPGASGNNDVNPFEVVAQEYVEAGALSSDDVAEVIKDIKTMSEFIRRVEEKRQDSKINNLTEDQKKYLDAVEAGYDPQQFLSEKDRRDRYNSISEDRIKDKNTELDVPRKALVVEALTLVKNYSPEDAQSLVDTYDQDTLINKAVSAKNDLVNYYETLWNNTITKHKETESENKKKELKNVEDLINTIKTQKDIFGINVTDILRTKMEEYATKNYGTVNAPKNYLQDQLEKDFIGTSNKLAFILAMTNGLKDLTPLMSKTGTKATNALSKIIRAENNKVTTGGLNTTKDNTAANSYFKTKLVGIEDALNAF